MTKTETITITKRYCDICGCVIDKTNNCDDYPMTYNIRQNNIVELCFVEADHGSPPVKDLCYHCVKAISDVIDERMRCND